MNTKTIKKIGGGKQITLPVSIQGMTVRVAPGPFKIGSVNHILPEEVVYTVKLNDELQAILFYLMKKKGNGPIIVATDEIIGNEQPLDMVKDPEYDYLWNIASLKVPAGAKNLDGASLTILHSEAPPQEGPGVRDRHPLYSPEKSQQKKVQ